MKIVVSPGPAFSGNPFFRLLNDALQKKGNRLAASGIRTLFWPDVYHVNFPEHRVSERKNLPRAIAGAAGMLGIMLIQKLRGCPVIWTVHDVLPLCGRYRALASLYMAWVRKMVDGYVFISASSRREFLRAYPGQAGKPALEAFHPFFAGAVSAGKDATALRAKLGLKPEDFVMGYLGDIKPYKNPGILRHIPEKLRDGRDIVLLVAGKADGMRVDWDTCLAGRRAIRIDKRVDDAELESMIRAVDVVLLPYAWGWNSGFLFLALTYGTRVLASGLPVFAEMQGIFGDYWVATLPPGAKNLSAAIANIIHSLSQKECKESDRARLDAYGRSHTFDRLAEDMLAFYASVRR